MFRKYTKKTTKPKSSSQKSKEKLDRVFSAFIRLRDAMPNGYVKCISCGKIVPFSDVDCGHYINRQHMSLRFSEMNCNAQCIHCNRFDEGNAVGYRQGLIKKYGESKVAMLESMKYQTNHISESEYQHMIEYYKNEAKRLSSMKGIYCKI